ncbi:MAG: cyclase family protein [Chloroflexi bacterium]|nr:cyclase family protein [Chloroflexota bacterium]
MQIFDLSVPLRNEMPYYPGDPAPQITRLEDHERGDAWTTTHLSVCAHVGTHVDAPLHRIRGAAPVDALSLQTLIGRAYVVDLSDVASEIHAEDLEARNIPLSAERLVLKTRNARLWAREGFQTDFVALGESGAHWVVERGIRLVALDYLSADLFTAQNFRAHEVLLGARVVIVEGILSGEIAEGWYTLICLPLRLQGADGAPARAVLIQGELESKEDKA